MDVPKRLSCLSERVRLVLTEGKQIAVFGWMEKNHDPHTKGLPLDKVQFFERPPDTFPVKTALILMTKFVSHTERNRVRRQNEVYSIPLHIGQVKSVLRAAANLLEVPQHSQETSSLNAGSEEVPLCIEIPQIRTESLYQLLARQPEEKRPTMSEEMRTFVTEFSFTAKLHPEGLVSKTTLGRILSKSGLTLSPKALIKEGWLEAISPGEGKKIAWYKAGPTMLTTSMKPEPKNMFEKARQRIEERAKLLEEKADLEQQLAVISRSLEDIAKIEALLTELEQSME